MSSPAENVIEKCGGAKAVADVCGCGKAQVYRWTYERSRGGTDGLVPAKHQIAILRASLAKGWGIAPTDFFPKDLLAELAA